MHTYNIFLTQYTNTVIMDIMLCSNFITWSLREVHLESHILYDLIYIK